MQIKKYLFLPKNFFWWWAILTVYDLIYAYFLQFIPYDLGYRLTFLHILSSDFISDLYAILRFPTHFVPIIWLQYLINYVKILSQSGQYGYPLTAIILGFLTVAVILFFIIGIGILVDWAIRKYSLRTARAILIILLAISLLSLFEMPLFLGLGTFFTHVFLPNSGIY